jgi:5-methylcytosine-specific restriction endonuclease McrA
MRTDILERKDEILQWISENQSKAFICRELNCKQDTLNRYLDKMGIIYVGNQSGKGYTKKHDKMTLQEYLNQSLDVQSNKVRKKLLAEGYKEHKCENCGLTQWLGQPIPLELHHKDGNRDNNTLENYVLLCPNCHAFTDSYRGKNCTK